MLRDEVVLVSFIPCDIVVGKVLADFELFFLSEKLLRLKVLVVDFLHPRVLLDLLDCVPFLWIRLQKTAQEMLNLIAELEFIFFQVVFGFHYLGMELRHVVGLEWYCSK
jgi:hypothetical protein